MPSLDTTKSFSSKVLSRGPVWAAILSLPLALQAANVDWDGDAADGIWASPTNWSANAIPTSSDNAQLLNATSDRAVTINAATTINKLTITQTTSSVVNTLNVNENLTITGAAPFAITATAGQASIVTNIAAGKTLLTTVGSASPSTVSPYAGTVNIGAGAVFRMTTTATSHNPTYTFSGPVVTSGSLATVEVTGAATSTLTFNGGLTLGAGGQANVNALGSVMNVAGTSNWGSGASATLSWKDTNLGARFLNSGTLTMDGATLNYNYVQGTNPASGTKDFRNTGTWTLKNSAAVAVTGTAGRNLNTVLQNNSNSGTLSVQSGSSLAFSSLLNTSILNVGSSTSNVSDATVKLGGMSDYTRDVVLNNGYTTGSSTMSVLGNTQLGRNAYAASGGVTTALQTTSVTVLDNGTTRNGGGGSSTTDSTTGSVINMGDGVTPTLFSLTNANVAVNNAVGNTINLKAGATLLLKSLQTTAATAGTTTVANRGTFVQAGVLQLQGNAAGGTRSFTHDAGSTYKISGVNAGITALAGVSSTTSVAAITFTSAGTVTGASAHDTLTYTNSTGSATFNTLAFSVNSGEITPGAGTNGGGTASIGIMEFVNANVSLTGTTKLSFDIGGVGTNPALYDQIVLGSARTLSIGASTGSVLDIWLTNGFSRIGGPSGQSYVLLQAGSITGTFTTLLFQGQAVTNEYTLDYLGDQVVLNLAMIPEPSTYTLWVAAGVVAFAALRRRRGNA